MQTTRAPDQAWKRLAYMQAVVAQRPAVAWLVGCLSLYDQLELTLELLQDDTWPDEFALPPPANVRRFRRRRVHR